jgi:hypothetical protein
MCDSMSSQILSELKSNLRRVQPRTPGASDLLEHIQIGGITDGNMRESLFRYAMGLVRHHTERQDDPKQLANMVHSNLHDLPDTLEGLVEKCQLLHDGTIIPELQWSKWFALILLLQARLEVLRHERDESHKMQEPYEHLSRTDEHDLMLFMLTQELKATFDPDSAPNKAPDESASACIMLFWDCFLGSEVPMAQFLFAEAALRAGRPPFAFLTWLRIANEKNYPSATRAEGREYIFQEQVKQYMKDISYPRCAEGLNIDISKGFYRRKADIQFSNYLVSKSMNESEPNHRARVMKAVLQCFVMPGSMNLDEFAFRFSDPNHT